LKYSNNEINTIKTGKRAGSQVICTTPLPARAPLKKERR